MRTMKSAGLKGFVRKIPADLASRFTFIRLTTLSFKLSAETAPSQSSPPQSLTASESRPCSRHCLVISALTCLHFLLPPLSFPRPRPAPLIPCSLDTSPSSLSKTIDAQVEGEMATLKETVNDMVFKLRIFSSEVTRVSLEVGTKGQLGGQAVVFGVEGVWKELVSLGGSMMGERTADNRF